MAPPVNRKIYISINGKEVEHTYQGIRKEIKRVSRELDRLTPGTKDFEEKSKELRKVEQRFEEVREATGRLKKEIEPLEGSYNDLNRKVKQVNSELDRLAPNTKDFTEKKDELDRLEKEFNEVAKATGRLKKELEPLEGSYDDLDRKVKQVNAELNRLAPNTRDFTEKKGELDRLEKEFDEVAKATGRTNRGLQQSNNLLSGLKGMIAGAFTIGAVQQLASRIISVRSEFEKYFAVLKTSLGTSKAANDEFNMIREFAAETPFSVRELTDSFVKLTNQGFKPSREEMRKMGDLAASTGKQYDQLAEAIIDAQTGEFERLKEFGIRAQKEGDKVTFTFKEQKTQVDFTSDAIQDYILSLGDLQGVSGSMAEISETLGGKISNLGDSWDTLLYNLGDSSIYKGAIGFLNRMLTSVNDLVAEQKNFEEQMRATSGAANAHFEILKSGNFTQEERRRLISEINSQYGEYLPHLIDEQASLEEIDRIQKEMNKNFEKRILQQAFEKEMAAFAEAQANSARAAYELEKERAKLNLGEQDLSPTQIALQQSTLQSLIDLNRQAIANAEETKQEIQDKYKSMAEELGFVFSDLFGKPDSDDDPVVEGARERYEAIIAEKKGLHSVIGELEDRHLKHSVDSTTEAEELKRYQIRLTAEEQRAALNKLVDDLQLAAEQFPELAQVAKRAAQLQTVVDTYRGAQAAYNSLAVIPLVGPALGAAAAAAAVVAGIARVKKIEQAKFDKGGITKGLGFKDETGHQVAGIVHEDEQIIPKWMRQNPRYAPTLDALEFARANYIRRFAEGGVATSKTINNTTTQTIQVSSLEQMIERLIERLDKPAIAVVTRQARKDLEEKTALEARINQNKKLS